MSKFGLPLVIVTSFLISLATLRALPLGLDIAFESMAHQIANARSLFLLHISASSIALVLGAVQMVPRIRNRYPLFHRWLGRLYACAVALGGLAGLFIAFQIEELGATIGFALLAVAWIFVTAKAVLLARSREIARHRRWMICGFALTFAAVTLRLQLATFMFGFGMPYEEVYPILAWSCWVPNILFALWYVRR